jgi:hypothetical protein
MMNMLPRLPRKSIGAAQGSPAWASQLNFRSSTEVSDIIGAPRKLSYSQNIRSSTVILKAALTATQRVRDCSNGAESGRFVGVTGGGGGPI